MEINLNKINFSSENEAGFCKRVWNPKKDTYINRLKALNFIHKERILDAGSGFGQWTYALSTLNSQVHAIEFDENRVSVSKAIFDFLDVSNINLCMGSVEDLPYDDNTFDAVFSYSVILCTDYRKTLNEFYRVLKPGGKLYFNTNGLGWYLYNLIHTHNDTSDFSSREMAKVAIETSLHYFATGEFKRGKYAAVITPRSVVLKDLIELGFKNIISGEEGSINLNNEKILPFFKGEYEGAEGVTEYLCEK